MTTFRNFIQQQFGIVFKQERLLQEALTHSSYSNESKKTIVHNERIEFLGDAVLELYVSQYLYQAYPQLPEGKLTKLRAQIVREESLSKLAQECHLDRALLLGKGEELTGGRKRPSVLSDAFEAFVGALYLDQGFVAAAHFLEQVIVPKIQNEQFTLVQDYKTMLQEVLQQSGAVKITYRLEEESGPAHQKFFRVAVYLEDQLIGRGSGKAKKAAEQQAAKQALEQFGNRE